MKKRVLIGIAGVFAFLIIIAISTSAGREGIKQGSQSTSEGSADTALSSFPTATPTSSPSTIRIRKSSTVPEKDSNVVGVITLEDYNLTIHNKNDFDWKTCDIELNSFPEVEYEHSSSQTIKANQKVIIDISQFSKYKKTVADIAPEVVKDVSLGCFDNKNEYLYGFWKLN